jgi:flagellar L-ring protein precursor FlgH
VVEGKTGDSRHNFEVREHDRGWHRLSRGDNTIDSSKKAQARIAYGGRGQIPRCSRTVYGEQIFNVLLPF